MDELKHQAEKVMSSRGDTVENVCKMLSLAWQFGSDILLHECASWIRDNGIDDICQRDEFKRIFGPESPFVARFICMCLRHKLN